MSKIVITLAVAKQYAVSLGLNADSFNSCLDPNKYSDKIQKQGSSEGSQYGVSDTPTFYIGNQKAGYTQIVGAQPLPSFEQLMKQESSGNNEQQRQVYTNI